MTLPLPAYNVELIAEKNKHSYKCRWLDLDANREQTSWFESIYPGVTGVLGIINKPALVPWAKRVALENMRAELMTVDGQVYDGEIHLDSKLIDEMLKRAYARPDQLKDNAAKLGTEAHEYIDRIVRGNTLGPLPDAILEPVSAFADWYASSGFKFVAGDTKIASRAHRYGGSLDALAQRGQRLCLLDWKTSKAIYDEYALQVAAYVRGFEEMYGVEIAEAWCVRFIKPGVSGPSFEALQVLNIEESFQAFLDAKRLSERMKLDHFIRPPKIKKEKHNEP